RPSGRGCGGSRTPPPAAAPAPAPSDGSLKKFAFAGENAQVTFVGAKVTGKHDGGFRVVKGSIDLPATGLEGARVEVTIDMTSVYTDAEKLTGHLQSPDFFDVAQFPEAKFVATTFAPGENGLTTVTGDLTLHGVTKTISFPATITSTADAATARAEFGLNRKDFGIVYPVMPDDLIADEVLLRFDIKAAPGA
ncbi:MAG: YceI family protein, partial [Myxococcota bacterium]